MSSGTSAPTARWSKGVWAFALFLGVYGLQSWRASGDAGEGLSAYGTFGAELAGNLQEKLRTRAMVLGALSLLLAFLGFFGTPYRFIAKRVAVALPTMAVAVFAAFSARVFYARVWGGDAAMYGRFGETGENAALFALSLAGLIAGVGASVFVYRKGRRWFPAPVIDAAQDPSTDAEGPLLAQGPTGSAAIAHASWTFGVTPWSWSLWSIANGIAGVATARALLGLRAGWTQGELLRTPIALGMVSFAAIVVAFCALRRAVRVDGAARTVRVWPMGVPLLPTRAEPFEAFSSITEFVTLVKVRRGRDYTHYELRLNRVAGGHLVVAQGIDPKRHAMEAALLQRITGLPLRVRARPEVGDAELSTEMDLALSHAKRTAWALTPLWALTLMGWWGSVKYSQMGHELLQYNDLLAGIACGFVPVLALVVLPRMIPTTLVRLAESVRWHRIVSTRPATPLPAAPFAMTLFGALLMLDVSWGSLANPFIAPGPLTSMFVRTNSEERTPEPSAARHAHAGTLPSAPSAHTVDAGARTAAPVGAAAHAEPPSGTADAGLPPLPAAAQAEPVPYGPSFEGLSNSDDGTDHRWVCTGGVHTLQGVRIPGRVLWASGNCRMTLTDCVLGASRSESDRGAVDVSERAQVTLQNCQIESNHNGVQAFDRGSLVLQGGSVQGADSAIFAVDRARVTVEGTRVSGRRNSIWAWDRARVSLRGARVEGPVVRDDRARIRDEGENTGLTIP